MELGDIIAALGTYVSDEDGGTDEEKMKDVVKALRNHESTQVKDVAQRLINVGAASSKKDVEKRVATADKKVADLTRELAELQQQIDTSKGQPSEKEADLERRLKKADKELAAVTAERDAERQGRQQDTVEKVRTAFLSHLSPRVDAFGLKALKNDFAGRFRPKEGGGVEVLDEDGEVIEPPKGKTAEEVLADHAFATVPASNRLHPLQPGGGVSRGGGPTTVTVEQLAEEKRQTVKPFL